MTYLLVEEIQMPKLDKLFDILNSSATFIFHENQAYPADAGCRKEAHINCACMPQEMKIPMTELAFIKGQREKTSSIGPHQIDLLDLPEHSRQVKKADAARRREKRAC